jgi:hypothetical protein
MLMLLLLGEGGMSAQTVRRGPDLPKFLGREVTITERDLDADGYFPKGPASVCVEEPPERQCYKAPKDFGRDPFVELVQLGKGESALLFSAASGGVSGFAVHFALLHPGKGSQLEDLFLSDVTVSNQSQHAFWTESDISDTPIFLTADFVWGPDESHYEPHRYIISAYVWKYSNLVQGRYYYLDDQYMAVPKYDVEPNPNEDILAAEKPEILARLRRVKAAEIEQQGPR